MLRARASGGREFGITFPVAYSGPRALHAIELSSSWNDIGECDAIEVFTLHAFRLGKYSFQLAEGMNDARVVVTNAG